VSKKIIIALATFLTTQIVFADRYDGVITKCQNNGVVITIEGKDGFFSSREVSLKKNGKLLFKEDYTVEEFPYNEHLSDAYVPREFNEIQMEAYRIRPLSSTAEQDWYFRVSESVIIHQTYSKFGRESEALIVQIKNTKDFLEFDMKTSCTFKVSR